ncbi:hypothetical protein ACXM2N_08430 [Corynebacterium sp. ZY180755]
MEKTMTYAFAGMFAAFILSAPIIPNWLLVIPAGVVISEIALASRQNKQS